MFSELLVILLQTIQVGQLKKSISMYCKIQASKWKNKNWKSPRKGSSRIWNFMVSNVIGCKKDTNLVLSVM